jgi:hypothetical protein
MKLQIVYDVISSMDNLYFEQAWASAWSLKRYNPDAHVILLTDQATCDTIETEERKAALEVIDEVCVVEFDGDYTDKEKSRWIKTNMRNLIKGDFLFIDADTIITGKLDNIDKIECAVGAVLDNHCHSDEISAFPIFRIMYSDLLQQIYGVKYRENTDVYNSGVLWVKDVTKAYDFFNRWHDNWLISRSKGECRDQLSMTKTIQDMGQSVTELPGIYNCQIRSSVQYLHDALIVHTFSRQEDSAISPLFGYQLYHQIRQDKRIADKSAQMLIDCKRCFNSPSFLMDKQWMEIRFLPSFTLLYNLLNSTRRMDNVLLKTINFLSRAAMWIRRKTN